MTSLSQINNLETLDSARTELLTMIENNKSEPKHSPRLTLGGVKFFLNKELRLWLFQKF